MGRLALVVALASFGCSSVVGPSCEANEDCAPGEVCSENACARVCNVDRDCGANDCNAGSVCSGGVCVAGCRTEGPVIAAVDADGSVESVTGDPRGPRAAHRLRHEITITGDQLEGAWVSLVPTSGAEIALAVRSSQVAGVVAAVPPDLAGGLYQLTVANGAGADQTAMWVLQGEMGAAGAPGPAGASGPAGPPPTAMQIQNAVNGLSSVTFNDVTTGDLTVTGVATGQFAVRADESVNLTDFTETVGNAGLVVRTDYTDTAYTPGVFWATDDNSPMKPKAGIWLQTMNAGSSLQLGTSNAYGTGITNTALTVDRLGRVGVGTGPIANFVVSEPRAEPSLMPFASDVERAGILIETQYADGQYTPGLFWHTTNNEPGKPKAGIWVHTKNTGSELHLGTSNAYASGITSTGVVIDESGSVTIPGCLNAGGMNLGGGCPSDVRLKHDIEPLTGSLSVVQSLLPVAYRYDSDPDRREVGLLAQDVEEVLPHLVFEREGRKHVRYGLELQMHLLEAIRELKSQLDDERRHRRRIDRRLAALESRADRH